MYKFQDFNQHAPIVSYKQPVYKQLALEWQIAKQLSELHSFSPRNSKKYRLKKVDLFRWNKRERAVKPTIC